MQCGKGQGWPWSVWPCSVRRDRDGGCGHAVWEGSGMEGVAMQCGKGQGWSVWPCSVRRDRDGGCGHAVWEGTGIEGVAMQCGPPFITDDVKIAIIAARYGRYHDNISVTPTIK